MDVIAKGHGAPHFVPCRELEDFFFELLRQLPRHEIFESID